jgi:hypothetical protein
MNAIRIRKTIDSDTLHLPELGALIGQTVDIVIQGPIHADRLPEGVVPGIGDWDAVLMASQQLRDYDYNAQRDQDARDLRDIQDRIG